MDTPTNRNEINPTPHGSSNGRIRRGFARLLVAGGLAAGLSLTAGSLTASAASPGPFNYAQCHPYASRIIQDVEAYRSYASEYVMLQAALVNVTTGVTSYSHWVLGTGATAHAAITWSNVPRGQYNVFYHWASWNGARGQYVYSSWYQLTGAALVSSGATETFPGSGMSIGGSTGRCVI